MFHGMFYFRWVCKCHGALHAQRKLQFELSQKIVHLKSDILQCACKPSFFVFLVYAMFDFGSMQINWDDAEMYSQRNLQLESSHNTKTLASHFKMFETDFKICWKTKLLVPISEFGEIDFKFVVRKTILQEISNFLII